MKSKPDNTIGMSEWMAVLNHVSSDPDPVPPGYFNAEELSDKTGMCLTTIRVRIRKARQKSLIESIKLKRADSSGRAQLTTYYRPKPGALAMPSKR